MKLKFLFSISLYKLNKKEAEKFKIKGPIIIARFPEEQSECLYQWVECWQVNRQKKELIDRFKSRSKQAVEDLEVVVRELP